MHTSKDRKWCVGGEDNRDVLDNVGPEHNMNSMELGMECEFVGIICTDFVLDFFFQGAYMDLSKSALKTDGCFSCC